MIVCSTTWYVIDADVELLPLFVTAAPEVFLHCCNFLLLFSHAVHSLHNISLCFNTLLSWESVKKKSPIVMFWSHHHCHHHRYQWRFVLHWNALTRQDWVGSVYLWNHIIHRGECSVNNPHEQPGSTLCFFNSIIFIRSFKWVQACMLSKTWDSGWSWEMNTTSGLTWGR